MSESTLFPLFCRKTGQTPSQSSTIISLLSLSLSLSVISLLLVFASSAFFNRMEGALGLLRIRVKRGINLVVRDSTSSDPYVTVSMGNQKLKTRVVKNSCNPEWNDELTLAVTDRNLPLLLTVYDKDTFTADDTMGEAEIDIGPYLECVEMHIENLPSPTTIRRIQPGGDNCLAHESSIVWKDGKIVQDLIARLRNVETGEVELQLQWIDLPGCKRNSTS